VGGRGVARQWISGTNSRMTTVDYRITEAGLGRIAMNSRIYLKNFHFYGHIIIYGSGRMADFMI
jgi:hypothetical protein